MLKISSPKDAEVDGRRGFWNDLASGVACNADARYDIAIDCALEKGLDLPDIFSV